MSLPAKRIWQWFFVLLFVFIVNMAAFLIIKAILGQAVDMQNVRGFAILSLLVGLIAAFGYTWLRVFAVVFILSDLLGICYMYYIVLTHRSDGWSDLTSLVGFMLIAAVGIIVGMIAQLIARRLKRNKVKP